MEAELAAWLRTIFPGGPALLANGHDAAVVPTSTRTAMTVDTHQEGIHFRWAWAPARKLGARYVGVVLSDLAAVGARPSYGVLSLTVPKGFPLQRVKDFCKGMADRARAEGFHIAGGDISNGAAFAAVLTALGEAPRRPLGRKARKGDWLWISGAVGEAGSELRQLLGKRKTKALRWLTPPSNFALGRQLAGDRRVHGAMDVSDGLFLDARRFAESAGLGLEVDLHSVPTGVHGRQTKRMDFESLVSYLGAGEDYVLLAAAEAGVPLEGMWNIGVFHGKSETFRVFHGGEYWPWPETGFLHG